MSSVERRNLTTQIDYPNADTNGNNKAHITEDQPTETSDVARSAKGSYRKKLFRHGCLSFACFTAGWTFAQKGPAFPYFMKITETSTSKGSLFITSASIGLMTGSLLSGFALDKFNIEAVMILAGIMMGVSTAVMPWCAIYWTMILVNLFEGTGFGMVITSCLTECTKIWKGNKAARTYIQALLLCLPVGAIISPLILAQFFQEETNNNTTPFYAITNISNLSTTSSTTPTTRAESEELYIPFTMAGTLNFLFTVPFVVMLCMSSRQMNKSNTPKSELDIPLQNSSRASGRFDKLVAMYFIGQSFFLMNGVQNCVIQFLPYFLRTTLHWEKYLSADIMSLFWGMNGLGRIIGVFISRFLKSSIHLMFNVILMATSLFLLLLGSNIKSNAVIWISVGLYGLAIAAVVPCLLAWSLQEILPTRGRYSSFVVVSAALGGTTIPPIVGILTETYSLFYVIYTAIAMSLLLIVMCVCLFLFVKLKLQKQNKHENKETGPLTEKNIPES